MPVATSLFPEIEDIVEHGDPNRRAAAVRQISDLFLRGADRFGPAHVGLFDDVLTSLAATSGLATRAELASRLASLPNAPPMLVGQLARADEIDVAGPLLQHSPLIAEAALIDIAQARGQTHLLAISRRSMLTAGVTDVIIRRGDREVVRSVAGNGGAAFSETGYSTLIKRSSDDGILALTVGQRTDISPAQLKDLLAGSADIVRRRLFEAASPARKAAINKTMIEMVGRAKPAARDFAAAQRTIISLHQTEGLQEMTLLDFAKAHRYEETIAALSAISGVRISTIDSLMSGERHDPILILGKSLGLQWATVRALILLRLGPNRVPSATDLEAARISFERLSAATAQRVMNFWKARQPTN
jgi:hypothetical protein